MFKTAAIEKRAKETNHKTKTGDLQNSKRKPKSCKQQTAKYKK